MKGLRFLHCRFHRNRGHSCGTGAYELFHRTHLAFTKMTSKACLFPIYSDERTSKYLLAHNFVPSNFDAYIIGPSLSANLNPKTIPQATGSTNFSMMGANITEEKAWVVDKAMEKSSPKFVILCLHPYSHCRSYGMKSAMINPREYYGALGSVSLYKSYLLEFIRTRNLMPSKFPQDQYNDRGANHYNKLLQKSAVLRKIEIQTRVGAERCYPYRH